MPDCFDSLRESRNDPSSLLLASTGRQFFSFVVSVMRYHLSYSLENRTSKIENRNATCSAHSYQFSSSIIFKIEARALWSATANEPLPREPIFELAGPDLVGVRSKPVQAAKTTAPPSRT